MTTTTVTAVTTRPPVLVTRPRNPLRAVVEALADRAHRAADREAVAYGWEVRRLPWGGRSYRDPRVTALAAARGNHPTRPRHLAAVRGAR